MKAAVLLVFVLVSAAACGDSQSTTAPTTPTTPTIKTDTFTSILAVRGSTSHGFIVSTAGTVSVTLLNAGPSSMKVGLGLGIPNANGASCNLNTSLTTTGGSDPQIIATTDPGTFCVDVYDVGNLTGEVGIAVKIVHP
jgi:hypothetical protein